MMSKPYEPLYKEGEWDCKDFETCPFDEGFLCHKCAFKKLDDLQVALSTIFNEYTISGSIDAIQAMDKVDRAYEDSLIEHQTSEVTQA